MFSQNQRAFKEWAVICDSLLMGRQILLMRKGGISEEDGIFRLDDPEFFLMPTYEHQKEDLLQPAYEPLLKQTLSVPYNPMTVSFPGYAVVDTVMAAKSEDAVNRLAFEYAWNEIYVRTRFDYNPYDLLYLILLRVYALPKPHQLPIKPEYGGCRSWVTLDQPLSTAGARPALSDAAFNARRRLLLDSLDTKKEVTIIR